MHDSPVPMTHGYLFMKELLYLDREVLGAILATRLMHRSAPMSLEKVVENSSTG